MPLILGKQGVVVHFQRLGQLVDLKNGSGAVARLDVAQHGLRDIAAVGLQLGGQLLLGKAAELPGSISLSRRCCGSEGYFFSLPYSIESWVFFK